MIAAMDPFSQAPTVQLRLLVASAVCPAIRVMPVLCHLTHHSLRSTAVHLHESRSACARHTRS